MEWIRTNYDRALAFAAALFLAFSAVAIFRNAIAFNDEAASLTAPAHRAAAPPPKAKELEAALQKVRQPPQWTTSGRSGLFVPEKYFIGPNGVPATLQTTEVHPPVPNEWLDQFGLPIADADVLTQDPDKDGFNNLEEWQAHTNPTDKNSHPAYVTKLRMRSFALEPFRLVFASWVEDTYAINTSDLREPTQFLKIGDPIRGTKFKIVKFTPKYERNKYGTRVDLSELTLENQETHEQLNLVKEKIMISPESVGHFTYSIAEPHEFAIKKDQEFSLPPESDIKYKLIDVRADRAVIVNSATNETIEVPLVSP
jgi:hypothetical protein